MEINVENNKAQMRKGVLELCILSLLSREDLYVSDILGRMKTSNLIVVEGTLYPMLNRLKNEGYLTYRWEESRFGPPRKYYTLTAHGISFLSALSKSWKELIESVNIIISQGHEKDING